MANAPINQDGYELPIMESFHTIQGEGFHAGKPAWFIRLGGCDVGCHWCDVKESWPMDGHATKSVEEIVGEVNDSFSDFAVITGGEPTMYNLDKLTSALNERGLQTHIETSGVYPLTGTWHWICFSPKKFKKPTEEIYKVANELKVVINHKSDLQWAEEQRAMINDDCVLSLQPEWDKRKEMEPLIVDFVKTHPHWRISLQTHKYIGVP